MGFDEEIPLHAGLSFFRGVGRALDLGATRNVYDDPLTPAAADRRAIRSDWATVGRDLMSAMDRFGKSGASAR